MGLIFLTLEREVDPKDVFWEKYVRHAYQEGIAIACVNRNLMFDEEFSYYILTDTDGYLKEDGFETLESAKGAMDEKLIELGHHLLTEKHLVMK